MEGTGLIDGAPSCKVPCRSGSNPPGIADLAGHQWDRQRGLFPPGPDHHASDPAIFHVEFRSVSSFIPTSARGNYAHQDTNPTSRGSQRWRWTRYPRAQSVSIRWVHCEMRLERIGLSL